MTDNIEKPQDSELEHDSETKFDYIEKINFIMHHIRNVQENCVLLGTRLIKIGEVDLGRNLIANGFIHDHSKFSGVEWEQLWKENPDKKALSLAIKQHNCTNPHHPEFWGGIKKIPRLYLAEMMCDIKARSNEFGTSVREWFEKEATVKYGFDSNDDIYHQGMYFLNLLCDTPFQKVEDEQETQSS